MGVVLYRMRELFLDELVENGWPYPVILFFKVPHFFDHLRHGFTDSSFLEESYIIDVHELFGEEILAEFWDAH